MKVKNIVLLIITTTVVFSLFTLILKKEYKVVVIKDVGPLAFNDSIIYVRYYKDDYGPGIETKLKRHGSSFCFSGRNEKQTFCI